MKDTTTIKLKKSTAELLNKLKIHPRQPYEEVIFELVKEEQKKGKELGKKYTPDNLDRIIFFERILSSV